MPYIAVVVVTDKYFDTAPLVVANSIYLNIAFFFFPC